MSRDSPAIVREAIDHFPRTNFRWRVSYNGTIVSNALNLRPFRVANRPRVEIIGGNSIGTLYTLVMVDPDVLAPSNPNQTEYLHWLVINIPGNMEASSGEEIISYEGPRPEVGIHRISFVLFQQPGRLNGVYRPGRRQDFIRGDFAEYNGLGFPIAALYFNCQRESGWGGRSRR